MSACETFFILSVMCDKKEFYLSFKYGDIEDTDWIKFFQIAADMQTQRRALFREEFSCRTFNLKEFITCTHGHITWPPTRCVPPGSILSVIL